MKTFVGAAVSLPLLLAVLQPADALAAAPVSPPRGAIGSLADPNFAARARAVTPGQRIRVEDLTIDGASEPMVVERFEVFTPSARIEVHRDGGTEVVAPPPAAYFRGHLLSDPGSSVFLVVDERVRGVVRTDGRFFVLHPPESLSPRWPAVVAVDEIVEDATASARNGGWFCGNEVGAMNAGEDGAFQAMFEPSTTTAAATTDGAIYQADLAIETDWEFLDLFGGSTAAATDYVGALIGAISAIYERDVGTRLMIGFLSLWDVPSSGGDPWEATTSASAALGEVGDFWHAERSTVPRTTVHFLSGKNVNSGVAWVGVLCRDDFTSSLGWGGAYGVTMGIDGDFSPGSSAIVWDILGVSHELGHNFDSPHTHCYDDIPLAGDPPVDRCFNAESGCYSGATSMPPDGGSIMSYCHLLGSLGNISLDFGEDGRFGERSGRVPQRMRAHVEAVARQAPACLPEVAQGNLLWSSEAGRASLWWLDAQGDLERFRTYGPNSGWSAESYVRSAGGGGRMLWTELAVGRASVWQLDANDDLVDFQVYGPQAGWIATSYDTAVDGTGRLLWNRSSDGRASLWTLRTDGSLASYRLYGPNAGWTATSYDLVPDGTGRLLWSRHSDGLASVWRLDAEGDLVSYRLYGPHPGWTATSYQQSADGTARLLWNRDSDGLASLWLLDAAGDRLSLQTYGPNVGWTTTSVDR